MRTTIAPTCLGLSLCLSFAVGAVAAHGQTSQPGGSPSTGPASGISPGRATGISPEGSGPAVRRGLPSNPGLSGEAGGRPTMMDRLDGTRMRDRSRLSDQGRLRQRRGDRMMPGESTDRFPASRMLPLRPGSPADAERERMRNLGLEPEGSPSASQRRATRRTGADYSQRECEQIWDSGTGMNRQQWSASCRRVGQRMDQIERLGSQRPGPQRMDRRAPVSPSDIGVFGSQADPDDR